MTNDNPATDMLLSTVDDGVLLLTFNRPQRRNAWTPELEDEYFAALVQASKDPAVRAIVITGAGDAFCPGVDMDALSAAARGQVVDRPRWPVTMARAVPKPIIAAINGACAGIGFIQACAADIRFAARGAKLTTSFARRGLPAENGLAWLLPRLVGTAVATDLLLSARVVLADEAHTLGLVHRVCEPEHVLAESLAYARDLARNCSPQAMAAIKGQLVVDWERTAEDSRRAAVALAHDMRTRPDFVEGVTSFVERRPPRFEGLAHDVNIGRDKADKADKAIGS